MFSRLLGISLACGSEKNTCESYMQLCLVLVIAARSGCCLEVSCAIKSKDFQLLGIFFCDVFIQLHQRFLEHNKLITVDEQSKRGCLSPYQNNGHAESPWLLASFSAPTLALLRVPTNDGFTLRSTVIMLQDSNHWWSHRGPVFLSAILDRSEYLPRSQSTRALVYIRVIWIRREVSRLSGFAESSGCDPSTK